MNKTFWDKLNDFPPVMCRLLARTPTPQGGVRPLTDEEIGHAADITVMEVRGTAWNTSWDRFTLNEVKRYTEACGIYLEDRANLRKHTNYIRRSPAFRYLQGTEPWRDYLSDLARHYLAECESKRN